MKKQAILKAVILKHGWKILREKGRGALRLRDLAKESDCSVGTIYNLFENLDEIILRLNLKCLDQLYSSLHREMKEGIVHQESLKKVLRRLGKAYIAFGIEYPLMWRSLFENLAIDPVPQWYQEKVDGEMAVIRQTIESSYGLEVEKVSQIVNFFWAAIHGMTAIILNKKMKEIDDDYIDTYFDQCLRGFIE